MLKIAFSTVACPDWTIERVAGEASRLGFGGVEFRTLGPGAAKLTCDPALSDPHKVRDVLAREGVGAVGVASSARFDEAVQPPVMGLVFGDFERPVRLAKWDVDLASAIGAPLVRVFAFEPAPGERREKARARIIERLSLVVDAARNLGVRIALENGGGFPRSEDVAAIVNEIANPLLGVCYSIAAGHAAGERPREAIERVGDNLLSIRVKDLRDGRPCPLGQGDIPVRDAVSIAAAAGWSGPVIYEWDRLWAPEIGGAWPALEHAAARLYEWAGAGRGLERTAALAGT